MGSNPSLSAILRRFGASEGNLKQQIDALLSSDFAKQKQYTSYSN